MINNAVTIKLQMGLNQRMYDNGKIPYDLYSKTNEILISRLTNAERCDTISLSESKPKNERCARVSV